MRRLSNKGMTVQNGNVTLPYPIELPVFTKPMNRPGEELNHWKAIADRDNPNHIYGVVTKGYKLIPHQDAIGMFEDQISGLGPEFKNYQVTTRLWNEGARIQRTYKFPDIDHTIGKGDTVYLETRLYNSYDSSLRFITDTGFYRMVCSNGMYIGERIARYMMKHTNSLSMDDALGQIGKTIENFRAQVAILESWKKILMTPTCIQNVLEAIKFTKTQMEEVIALHETGTNRSIEEAIEAKKGMDRYLFFCILSQYMTHHVASVQRRIQLENKARIAIETITK